MNASTPAEVAALLRSAADAIESGDVVLPVVDMQFIVTGEDDQDRALTATAAHFPGFGWEGCLTEDALLGAGAHIHGRRGLFHVVISARADRLAFQTVHDLTAEQVTA